MPALANPRHEAFAQAIIAGIAKSDRQSYSQGRAYQAAGYLAKDAGKSGGSAEVCAARLLKKVQPLADRIAELQAEHNARLAKKLDLSKERIGRRLDKASEIAEQQGNAAAIVASELGIAKVFHRIDQPQASTSSDFSNVQNMSEIGRKLLQQVGLREPDDVSIQEAIAANDQLIAALEAIRDRAQGLTVDGETQTFIGR